MKDLRALIYTVCPLIKTYYARRQCHLHRMRYSLIVVRDAIDEAAKGRGFTGGEYYTLRILNEEIGKLTRKINKEKYRRLKKGERRKEALTS